MLHIPLQPFLLLAVILSLNSTYVTASPPTDDKKAPSQPQPVLSQDAIWAERDAGNIESAEAHEAVLINYLKTTDWDYTDLSEHNQEMFIHSAKIATARFKDEPKLDVVVKFYSVEGIRKDLAASVIDRYYNFAFVPLSTVRNKVPHKQDARYTYPAVFQVYLVGAESAEALEKKTNQKQERSKKLRFFHYLLHSGDGNDSNWLKTPDGREVSIDHENAFAPLSVYQRNLNIPAIKKSNQLASDQEVLEHPEQFYPGDQVYQSLKNRPDEPLIRQLKAYLTKNTFDEFIARKDAYIKSWETHLQKLQEETMVNGINPEECLKNKLNTGAQPPAKCSQ